MPVPLRATLAGELVALLTIETLPVAAPAVVGLNFILKVADCPDERLSGNVGPLAAKPVPLTCACEILKLAFPEFVSVSVCVLEEPT